MVMFNLPDGEKPLIIVGTRPEVTKMAPVIRMLEKAGRDFFLVHTGQHYDYNMSVQFLEELELRKPDVTIMTRSHRPEDQVGLLVRRIGAIIREQPISIVLVEGDTNSVLAGGLAANKLSVQLGHIEAGLRSHDLRMPEEHNRRVIDHISTHLFAPTQTSRTNLEKESVWGKVYVTGNTVIDACIHNVPLAERRSQILDTVPFESFALCTIHRAENVDDPHVLKQFVDAFLESPIGIVLPLHPRTRRRLKQHGLWARLSRSENLIILTPLGYFDFLMLMKHSDLILTDSGGVVEEATAPVIRKKVVILRLSVDRPEAVKSGFAVVAGCEKNAILKSIAWAQEDGSKLPRASPFGDGHAADRIVRILVNEDVI